jgi:hypothetical protein
MPLHREITKEARRRSEHDIKGHTINFHGVCRKCRSSATTIVSGMRNIHNKPRRTRRDR